jgi:hypothetical protein
LLPAQKLDFYTIKLRHYPTIKGSWAMSNSRKTLLGILALLPAILVLGVCGALIFNTFVKPVESAPDHLDTINYPMVIVALGTFAMTAISGISTIWLAWRSEGRQSREFELKLNSFNCSSMKRVQNSRKFQTETLPLGHRPIHRNIPWLSTGLPAGFAGAHAAAFHAVINRSCTVYPPGACS